MDALLIAFFLNLLTEAVGRSPRLGAILYARYGGSNQVVAGMALALAANAAIGAWAGGIIASMLSPEARNLFWALSLAAGGVGLFWMGRKLDELSGWRIGPLLTSFLGLFILGLGEGPAFMTAGIAASRADPWMAGIGGALGGIVGCGAMIAAGGAISPRLLGGVRIALGVIWLLLAFMIAVSALRLV